MTDLAQGNRAKLVINVGETYRVSTAGVATVTPAYGAPAGTVTITASYQDFGPYSVPAKIDVLATSGVASYTLLIKQPMELEPTIPPTLSGASAEAVVSAATSNVQNAVAPPTGLITPADSGVGGNLTGTYSYQTLFELDDGSITDPGTADPLTVTVAAKQVNLSGIPVSANSRVVARWLVRSKGTAVGIKSFFMLARIPNNTTTTYTDNIADASLGAGVNWAGSQRGKVSLGSVIWGAINGQATSVGTGSSRASYAETSIGFECLKNAANGGALRMTGVGVYCFAGVIDAVEGTGAGVHCFQNYTTGGGAVGLGYRAAYNIGSGSSIVAIGRSAAEGAVAGQANNSLVAIGEKALFGIPGGVNGVIGIGPFAGQYANAAGQLFIDPIGDQRASLLAAQRGSPIYADARAAAGAQRVYINGMARLGGDNLTYADLPSTNLNTVYKNCRATIIDSPLALSAANFGATVNAGGGSNTIPVFCDGTKWVLA